jgi:hypothetical protein
MKSFRHPLLRLSDGRRRLIFCGALLLSLIFWYVLQSLDAPLVTPAARWGMVSFQFANSVERSNEILESWNVAARQNAQSSLLIDFLFPLCYSTTLTIACLWAAGLLGERGFRKMKWLAATIAWAQWPAAGFDYVENVALWVQLQRPPVDPWPRVAFTAAAIKSLLIALGLGVWLAAIVVWILRRRAAIPPPPAGSTG